MHITQYVYFLQFCVKDKSWIPIAQFVTLMQASFFGGDYRPETCNKFHNFLFLKVRNTGEGTSKCWREG